MKAIFVPVWFLLSVTSSSAQTIDNAKNQLKLGQLSEAKKEIDAVLALEKFQKSPEAYYQKGKIYSAIALDPVLSKKYPDARMEAFNAIKKYTDIDDRMLISLQVDGYKPINDIYTGFYQEGANNFNNKNYQRALAGFANAITVSNFMKAKGWINLALDTNSVLYAGVAAEKLNRLADAATYYGKLAEARVKGDGFAEIYKWVANYYYEQKDIVAASRYLMLGKEVYPSDPFWDSLELDILREKGNKNELFALYEKVIAANPGSYLYRYNYAVELYQYAYHIDPSKRPAGSEAIIDKAESQVKEVVQLAPGYARAQLFFGQIIYNRAVDLLAMAKTTVDEEKKNEVKVTAVRLFGNARPHCLAVEQLLSSPPPSGARIKPEDIADLKEALDLLIIIYGQEGNKDKVKEYEGKFNALPAN